MVKSVKFNLSQNTFALFKSKENTLKVHEEAMKHRRTSESEHSSKSILKHSSASGCAKKKRLDDYLIDCSQEEKDRWINLIGGIIPKLSKTDSKIDLEEMIKTNLNSKLDLNNMDKLDDSDLNELNDSDNISNVVIPTFSIQNHTKYILFTFNLPGMRQGDVKLPLVHSNSINVAIYIDRGILTLPFEFKHSIQTENTMVKYTTEMVQVILEKSINQHWEINDITQIQPSFVHASSEDFDNHVQNNAVYIIEQEENTDDIDSTDSAQFEHVLEEDQIDSPRLTPSYQPFLTVDTSETSDTHKDKPKIPLGLVNMGLTCYINNVIQCLLTIPELKHYFQSDEYEQDINYDNPLATCKGKLARVFSHTIQIIENTRKPQFPRMLIVPQHLYLTLELA
jgi:hypothetical protein